MFTYGFYNSLNGDRKYDALQMSSIFDGIIEDGVFSNVGEFFAVVPGTGLQVIVKTGRAWFKHTWNLNDSWMPLNLEPADVLRPRIDSVVIEVNSNLEVRANSIKIVKGVPATNPTPPTMKHESGIDQYRLADVTVSTAATTIEETNIANKVGQGDTPFVIAPLKSVEISDLFNQWNGEFNDWFDNLKAQLSDNVVTNLQNQIDQKLDSTDFATVEDIKNKVPNKVITSQLIADGSYNIISDVGDIVYTMRTNLGDDWLLCNGEKFNEQHYPQLINEIPLETMVLNKQLIELTSDSSKNVTAVGEYTGYSPAFSLFSVENDDFLLTPMQLSIDGGNFNDYMAIVNKRTKTFRPFVQSMSSYSYRGMVIGDDFAGMRWGTSNGAAFALTFRIYRGDLATVDYAPLGMIELTVNFTNVAPALGWDYAIIGSYIVAVIVGSNNASWNLSRKYFYVNNTSDYKNIVQPSAGTPLDCFIKDSIFYTIDTVGSNVVVTTFDCETLEKIRVIGTYAAPTYWAPRATQLIDNKLINIASIYKGHIVISVIDLTDGTTSTADYILNGMPKYAISNATVDAGNSFIIGTLFRMNRANYIFYKNGRYICFLPPDPIFSYDSPSRNCKINSCFIVDDIKQGGTVTPIYIGDVIKDNVLSIPASYIIGEDQVKIATIVSNSGGDINANITKIYLGVTDFPNVPKIETNGQCYAYIKAK